MRALEIPPASHRKTSSAVAQSGTDDFSEAEAFADTAPEEVASEEGAPESDNNNPAEGIRKEAETPCPAHSNPDKGRAMKRRKSQLTRPSFKETSGDQSGFRRTTSLLPK